MYIQTIDNNLCTFTFIITAASLPYTVVYNIEDFATGYRSCVISKWYREYLIIYFSSTTLFLVSSVFAIATMNVCIIHKISRQKTVACGRGVERKEQSRQGVESGLGLTNNSWFNACHGLFSLLTPIINTNTLSLKHLINILPAFNLKIEIYIP